MHTRRNVNDYQHETLFIAVEEVSSVIYLRVNTRCEGSDIMDFVMRTKHIESRGIIMYIGLVSLTVGKDDQTIFGAMLLAAYIVRCCLLTVSQT